MNASPSWSAAVAAAIAAASASGQEATPPAVRPALVLRGERVILRPGRAIEKGTVVVQEGVIVAVGTDVQAPEGAREISGQLVCAGFVDPWSTFGVDAEAVHDERSTASTRSLDALDRYLDDRFRVEVLRAGVTSQRVQGAASSRLGGIGAWVRNHPEESLEESTILPDCCVSGTVGITRGGRGQDLFDRLTEIDRLVGDLADGKSYLQDRIEHKYELETWQKAIAEKEKELEEGFKKAKKDREKEEAEAKEKDKEFKEKEYKEDKKPAPPKFDEDKEILARLVNGDLPLVVEAHRAAELRALLEGTKPYDRLRLVIAGGTEAASVAKDLAARRVPVIVWPRAHGRVLDGGAPLPDEYGEADMGLAARLHEAGVQVLLGSGGASSGGGTRDLPLLAALAVGHGLERQAAFEALTLGAARALDVDGRIGSVERGKDADLLVLDGEPLDATTRVRFVVAGGELVWSAEN